AGGLGSDAGIVDLPSTIRRVTALAPPEVGARVAARAQAEPGPRLPAYSDLPAAPLGGRSAWGIFGPGDSPGTVALQTPERIAESARLVRTGRLFPLNAPATVPHPPLFLRRALKHTLLHEAGTPGFDDKMDDFFPQGSSQWDSLAHVGYAPGAFYNGATEDDIRAGRRNTIDRWARRGLAGRGVLIDVEAVLRGRDPAYHPGTSCAVTVEDLEAGRRLAGVEWQPGDVLLLHTGFLHWYTQQQAPVREKMAAGEDFAAVGLERSEAIVEYLWDARVSAVAADNGAVEVWPPDWEGGPFGFLHRMLIGQLGLALGELWWLHDLALSCRGDGRYAVFVTSAPLNVPGGVGSPANALAIK
ncbi:MAG TPA: cyclase family protein, partial [Acidimicrobiales bacterium]|nr:cyclase family protein [Acidimicrobiales bacterium]